MHALGTTGTSVGLVPNQKIEAGGAASSWGGNPGAEIQMVTLISERVYPLCSCLLRVATVE